MIALAHTNKAGHVAYGLPSLAGLGPTTDAQIGQILLQTQRRGTGRDAHKLYALDLKEASRLHFYLWRLATGRAPAN